MVALLITLFPVVFGGRGGGIAPEMMVALLITLFAFTLLFIFILIERINLEKMKDDIARIKLEEAA